MLSTIILFELSFSIPHFFIVYSITCASVYVYVCMHIACGKRIEWQMIYLKTNDNKKEKTLNLCQYNFLLLVAFSFSSYLYILVSHFSSQTFNRKEQSKTQKFLD